MKLLFRFLFLVSVLALGIPGASSAETHDGVALFPLTSLPKEFPRFYTPITGVEASLTVKLKAPVPICLPNTDQARSILWPGVELTLFGFDRDSGTWGDLGPARVSQDGSEICTDDDTGVTTDGLYVVAIRTSDLVSSLPEIVGNLGDASPVEPSRIFCNRLTEFACRRTCGGIYSARVGICTTQFLTCQFDCGNVNRLLRPACRARCSAESTICSTQALNNRRVCRNRCACD